MKDLRIAWTVASVPVTADTRQSLAFTDKLAGLGCRIEG